MDKFEIIEKYENEGYILLPNSMLEEDEIKAIEIKEDELLKLIHFGFSAKTLGYNKTILLIKYKGKHHLTIDEFLILIKNENDESLEEITNLLCFKEFFLPDFDEDKILPNWKEDFFFDDDDHLINFILDNCFDCHITLLNQKNKIINFVNDILTNRHKEIDVREYKDETIDILVSLNFHLLNKRTQNKSHIKSFYKNGLEKLALKGVPSCMNELGFNYYNGDNYYKKDIYKAEYWLNKAFECLDDPHLSSVLGCIYYGKINNGVIEEDKAFKYLTHSHFGGCNESTYMLADCFFYANGVFKSINTAINIIDSKLDEMRRMYLELDESLYAEFAFRKGKYTLENNESNDECERSLFYLLEARDAIKLRINSIGSKKDFVLAYEIFEYIEKAKLQYNVKPRTIINGGYLLTDHNNYWSGTEFKINKDDKGYYHIKFNFNGPQKNVIGGDTSIYYRERTSSIEYAIKFAIDVEEEILNQSIESIELEFGEMAICFKKDGYLRFYPIEELIYIPQNIEKLNQETILLRLEVDGVKLNELFYSPKEFAQGDYVRIQCDNKIKDAKVIEVKHLYEDELPIPLKYINHIIL